MPRLLWPLEARELKLSLEVRLDLLNCGVSCRGFYGLLRLSMASYSLLNSLFVTIFSPCVSVIFQDFCILWPFLYFLCSSSSSLLLQKAAQFSKFLFNISLYIARLIRAKTEHTLKKTANIN